MTGTEHRDLPLHVEEHGSGLPVVFTHGYGDTSSTWDAQVSALDSAYEVVVWDLRGHGRSAAPHDPSAYSRDLALADLRRVIGDRPAVILCGHSLGGYLSLAYAVEHPDAVKGLVLLATGPGFRSDDSRAKWNRILVRAARSFDVPDESIGIVEQPDSMVIDSLPGIGAPVLQIVGQDDTRYHGGVGYIERQVPDVSTLFVAGARHHPQSEQPAVVNAAIQDFLRDLATPEPE